MFSFLSPSVKRGDARQRRLVQVGISLAAALYALRPWMSVRLSELRSDERGLTTVEYVALGALVIVAAGAVGATIVTFIQARGAQITSTP
jgi:Flp pilus assembly pilin Flp